MSVNAVKKEGTISESGLLALSFLAFLLLGSAYSSDGSYSFISF